MASSPSISVTCVGHKIDGGVTVYILEVLRGSKEPRTVERRYQYLASFNKQLRKSKVALTPPFPPKLRRTSGDQRVAALNAYFGALCADEAAAAFLDQHPILARPPAALTAASAVAPAGTMAGTMEKKGRARSSWKRRHFEFNAATSELRYYTEQGGVLKGRMVRYAECCCCWQRLRNFFSN